ncbi:MAG: 16S rRNA (guanine(527)-N(7))-methyltransferase RsmG [Phycisphaerales bacterium]|nr:16S rRNA (guanine(527)-N(7))-methyltransferase RsmG [Phycisphaerales bacterium]
MSVTNDSREQFQTAIVPQLHDWGMFLRDEQIETLWRFYGRVVETNNKFNLTRIIEPRDFAVRHILDSLAAAVWAGSVNVAISTVLDVGTGAGAPAVPLAVAKPDWRITAIDGTAKKASFVQSCADELGIANLRCLHARAESWRSPAPFDLVVLKAVGSLERCLRYARSLVSMGGHVVIFKSAAMAADELANAERTAPEQGYSTPTLFHYMLSGSGDEPLERDLWVYRLTRR